MNETAHEHVASRDQYTHGHHESVLRSHRWRTVENSAAYLIPHLAAGQFILDVGSGPGTITIDLARRVAPGRVIGVDASHEIVDRATSLASDNGLTTAEFAVGDAYALAYPDDTFDIVHAHQVLQHLARPIDALQEMRRVLKPGGLLAVREVDYGGVLITPSTTGLPNWASTYDSVHRWNGGDPNAGRSLKSWTMRAGFTEITASASTWCYASEADREWWGGAWAVRATESEFAAHAIESGAADVADLADIAAAWRAWAATSEGWMMMPHAEIIAVK